MNHQLSSQIALFCFSFYREPFIYLIIYISCLIFSCQRPADFFIPYHHVRITADGETLDGDYLFGAVANSTSIAGMMKLDGEQVVLDDGRFELLLVPNPKNAAELQNLIWALLNQQYDAGGLIFRHVTALHVETDEDLPWSLDGDHPPSPPAVAINHRQRPLPLLL